MNNRLQILTDEEIAVLYTRPNFNDTERRHFFLLPDTVLKMLKIDDVNGRSTSTKLYFILQYGYFRARHQFFTMSYAEAEDDVLFVLAHYMPNDSAPKTLPTRKMQSQAKVKILKLMGFSADTKKIDKLILKKVGGLSRITQNLGEIFDEVVKYLEDKKMVLPSYSRLQDTIWCRIKKRRQAPD